ncbi:amino acid ABC transporter permease [Paraburkholderia fungorum]|jgi:polar amino acid transport system permease protein|uniref:Glutamate/aspartate import permease protein GltK n=1 Tax=Paraburkholderia fungorum TaxID=134537 RepID=A0AAU8T8Y2_9BURK|nr:amino acid ABC transporter permease [Paraburkholderia fungorum]AJZ63033.1 amino ABC transporter, permease, 3-TM region, His/Glu/Gln/Arg/opine family domain protein [Paraburkholderia fungorum]MBU7438056.1 amino acid ABC transporter permease [Paraburkholderia fungorum]PZR51048.1 MAG: amino acid ABC transporter permease [Paraburkholderia fungorum]QLD51850.1 amino acid ABC transporter permease [Paraburkholderia fungorum]
MLDILIHNAHFLLLGQYPNGPVGGLALTLILALLGLAFAFPLGVLLALCRVSPYRVLSVPSTVLVYIVRGVPLVMLVFWSYFLVPGLIGHLVSAFTTMVVTLVIYQAAYLSEIVRAGIESLPKGQTESARSLGMSYGATMRHVILPQALYNMLPSILSQCVSTVKDTSIGYVISVQELTFSAQQINASLLTQPFQVFFILALTYFVVCYTLTRCAHVMERRIAQRRASGKIQELRNVINDSILQS